MERQEVTSTNLKSVGYDPSLQMLEIEFQDGSVYRYFGVPEEEHRGLLEAESKGRYFIYNIRDRYRYEKVG